MTTDAQAASQPHGDLTNAPHADLTNDSGGAAASDAQGRDYAPYDPASVEDRLYAEWMRQGLFKPKSEAELRAQGLSLDDLIDSGREIRGELIKEHSGLDG